MKGLTYLLQPENPSYTAKGEYIKNLMIGMGLRDGGVITRGDVPNLDLNGAVVVSADAYSFHEERTASLLQALNGAHVIAAPSVLRMHEADHAANSGITVLLPEGQKDDFSAYAQKGTVIMVDEVSASAVPSALSDLRRENAGGHLVEKIQSVIMAFNQWSFVYPPGHFSRPDASKDKLTRCDVKGIEELIKTESEAGKNGVVVISGGRVTDDVMQNLRKAFNFRANVVIASQRDYKADLPSALVQLSEEIQRVPTRVFIDALAGTTLKVVKGGGWQDISLIASERMFAPENSQRFKQAVDHHHQYGSRDVILVGNISEADKGRLRDALAPAQQSPRASSAPRLATALRDYLSARGLLADEMPPAPRLG
jgi:hypothetical protein